MEYISSTKNINLSNTAVCLGNFDGIHLGHQKLIERTKQESVRRALSSVVFSFYPHPRKVIFSEEIRYLLTPKEKAFILNEMAVDYYIEYPFDTAFQELSPRRFIEEVIVSKLGAKVLIVGNGNQFGKNKEGNASLLKELCTQYGIDLIVVDHVGREDKISSTTIRSYIVEDRFDQANILMGRPYFMLDQVVSGKKIGRTISFPTANFVPDIEKLVPNNGIYVTKCLWQGQLYESVTNVGMNPTVHGERKTIETFIFDFSNDLYGQMIGLYFYEKIRAEKKFDSVSDLKEQIAKDVLFTKKYFESIKI